MLFSVSQPLVFVLRSLLVLTFSTSFSLAAEVLGKVEAAQLWHDHYGAEDSQNGIRFSWKLKVEGRAQTQSGYQIRVGKSVEALRAGKDLTWDSGEVSSGESLYIPYSGPDLTKAGSSYWQVRLRNSAQEWNQWSTPQALELSAAISQSTVPKEGSLEAIGHFECSDATLNEVFARTRLSQENHLFPKANFAPQERAWGAPLQLTARGYAFQSNLTNYYRAWATELLGTVAPDQPFPSLLDKGEDAASAPGFSEALTIIPFTHWQLTGDRSLIAPILVPAVAHVGAMQKNDPQYEGKAFGEDRGDWGNQDDPTSAGFLSLCHLALNCRLLGEMAAAMGHPPYMLQHKDWFGRIQKAFPKHFLDEDGHLIEKSQTALILALRLGLLPQEQKQPLADELAKRLREEGLRAGIFGKGAVLPVLSWTGHHEQAIELAKTFAESKEESPVELASATEWMMGFLAGLNHHSPGFKTIRIAPMIPATGVIDEVKARYETSYGPLAIHWKKTEGELKAEITLPPNTTGIISLPASEQAQITEGGLPLDEAAACQFMQFREGRQEIIAQSGNFSFLVSEGEAP